MDNTTMGEVLSTAVAAGAYVHLNAWGGWGAGRDGNLRCNQGGDGEERNERDWVPGLGF